MSRPAHAPDAQTGTLKLGDPPLIREGGWTASGLTELARHPNLVAVLSTGVLEPDETRSAAQSGPYVLYEAVEGPTLEELVGHEPVPLERVMRHAFDLLAGLDRLHTAKVVHGDLTPAHVLVTSDGVAKIALVGMARPADAGAPPGSYQYHGTAAYMAPEQIDGAGLSPATDIYALGLLVYRLLAGHPPFSAPTLEALLELQRRAAPEPLTRVVPPLPAALEAFIARCIEKDPAQRFENGGMAMEALFGVARANNLPRPLEAEAAPRPPAKMPWPEGLAACGARLAVAGALIGLPWVLGGIALAFPGSVRGPQAMTLAWLLFVAALEARSFHRAQARLDAGLTNVPPEPAQHKLGRFAIGVFGIVIAFGSFGAWPETIFSLVSPLWFALTCVAAIVAGPVCLELVREPLAELPQDGLRVRFQGQAGTRASVDGEPDETLPFELPLPPGGHEVAVRQATGTETFILRLPAADYLVVDIPAVRLTGRFPTMAVEPPSEGGFSPAAALASATLMLGPVLALLIGGVGLLVNPGSRVETLTWTKALIEGDYKPPAPPPRDALWGRMKAQASRNEARAYDIVVSTEKRPGTKALEQFTASFQLAPSSRAALGAAEAAARAKKVDLARSWLAKVADEDLTRLSVIDRAAQVAISIGDLDAALGLYAGALQRQPTHEDVRAAYVVALVWAKRQQTAVATLLADGPTAARFIKTARALVEHRQPLAPLLDVVDRVVKDPMQRTSRMSEALLAIAENLPADRAEEACRLVKALQGTGLRHPRLTAAARQSCR